MTSKRNTLSRFLRELWLVVIGVSIVAKLIGSAIGAPPVSLDLASMLVLYLFLDARVRIYEEGNR